MSQSIPTASFRLPRRLAFVSRPTAVVSALIASALCMACASNDGSSSAGSGGTGGTETQSEGGASAEVVAPTNQFTDNRDGQTYRTTIIGGQEWMAGNLNYEPSPNSVDGNLTSHCYDEDASNCAIYGRLYVWAAAVGGTEGSAAAPSAIRGICPEGWHLPSIREWGILGETVLALCGAYPPRASIAPER